MEKELGIYIHIPFCQSKCYYCDFNSHTNKNEYIDKYIKYLKKEIELYSETLSKHKLKTIFWGGGTPSLIDEKYIYEVLKSIYIKTDIQNLQELTIESNPKTLSSEKLTAYKKFGVNRISLGLQTLNEKLLKDIGRSHSIEDFYDTYNLVRKHGFDNVNVDIMFNLPNQTIGDLIETLEKVVKLEVEHISLYSLKLEEGTPMDIRYEKGEIDLPDEDVERDMYHRAIDFLAEKGYRHYEISNFAKPGYESKHNLMYWELKPYIGLGLSSHSNINSYRYGNVSSFDEYFKLLDENKKPISVEEKEYISIDMEIAEYLMLGLRLTKGIEIDVFEGKYKKDIETVFNNKLGKFIEDGLIVKDNRRIVLTRKGLDLCNIIFMELLP